MRVPVRAGGRGSEGCVMGRGVWYGSVTLLHACACEGRRKGEGRMLGGGGGVKRERGKSGGGNQQGEAEQ